MKVRLKPADHHACAYNRHVMPCEAAKLEGVDAYIDYDGFVVFDSPEGHLVCEVEPEGDGMRVTEYADDVVVLQRPSKRSVMDMIPVLQSRGVAVVVDIDDDLSNLHPLHPSYGDFEPQNNEDVNWKNLMMSCARADLVTTTTPTLIERYVKHDRWMLLPNCVPASMLGLPSLSKPGILGWSGYPHMHPGDLEVVGGGVAEALKATGWQFRNIGPEEDLPQRLGIPGPVQHTDGLEIDAYQLAIGTLGVGIVPLELSAFNEAKSYLKGLEMAARGVPFVASPTWAYRDLESKGIGFLAEGKGRKWKSALLALMTDDSYRQELSQQYREAVRENYTYEGNGWRWCEAWEQALEHRRSITPRKMERSVRV